MTKYFKLKNHYGTHEKLGKYKNKIILKYFNISITILASYISVLDGNVIIILMFETTGSY